MIPTIRMIRTFGRLRHFLALLASGGFLLTGCSLGGNAEQLAREQTVELLQQVQQHTDVATAPAPYTEALSADCWDYLRTATRENAGMYEIETFPFPEDFPRPAEYGDETLIFITFPDNRRVELLWFQQRFQQCQTGDEL